MCDQDHFEEDLKKYSRREIGTLAAVGIGAAMMLPRAGNAAEVSESDVSIETPDGECDAYFVAPATGVHAAVLVWPDIIAWLDSQTQVDKNKKVGAIGYCMGGPIVMRTAAAAADRVGAGVTFHGGGLVTKDPDSPHLLIPQMKAQFFIAIAENDDQRDPDSKQVLRDAFDQANLSAEIEVYPAGHGWCPPDTRVHNPDQAERAWGRMLALFKKTLA